MVAASLGVAMGNATAAQGGNDEYGYKYTDSNVPVPSVAYNWTEISATGTVTGLRDCYDDTSALPIGFDFGFYGYTYSQFYICTNGFIGFGSSYWYYWNSQIPSSSSPDNIVAAYWDELYAYYGDVYYQTIGVSPNQQLVVEWENVTDWYGDYYMTFEIILNETGEIWCQYKTLNGMTGSSATVGIEDSDGYVGVQYSYDSPSLSDGLAIKFWIGQISIFPESTGVGLMGADIPYTLSVKNWQTVSDSFGITYSSTLGWLVTLQDSIGNPLLDTDGDTVPDTGTVAPGDTVDFQVTVSIPASPAA